MYSQRKVVVLFASCIQSLVVRVILWLLRSWYLALNILPWLYRWWYGRGSIYLLGTAGVRQVYRLSSRHRTIATSTVSDLFCSARPNPTKVYTCGTGTPHLVVPHSDVIRSPFSPAHTGWLVSQICDCNVAYSDRRFFIICKHEIYAKSKFLTNSNITHLNSKQVPVGIYRWILKL